MGTASEISLKSDNHNKKMYLAQVVQKKTLQKGQGTKSKGFAQIIIAINNVIVINKKANKIQKVFVLYKLYFFH